MNEFEQLKQAILSQAEMLGICYSQIDLIYLDELIELKLQVRELSEQIQEEPTVINANTTTVNPLVRVLHIKQNRINILERNLAIYGMDNLNKRLRILDQELKLTKSKLEQIKLDKYGDDEIDIESQLENMG